MIYKIFPSFFFVRTLSFHLHLRIQFSLRFRAVRSMLCALLSDVFVVVIIFLDTTILVIIIGPLNRHWILRVSVRACVCVCVCVCECVCVKCSGELISNVKHEYSLTSCLLYTSGVKSKNTITRHCNHPSVSVGLCLTQREYPYTPLISSKTADS